MLIAWCALHRAGNWLYGSPNPRGPTVSAGGRPLAFGVDGCLPRRPQANL